jgi:rhamnogalacturonyl hydrolase YesR
MEMIWNKISGIKPLSGLLVLLFLNQTLLNAQQLPERKDVLEKLVLANDYFMKKWPDVGKTLITDRERPSNIWTRGVYYEGLMALHTIYPKKEYYEYAVKWGEFHNWGMRNGNTTRNADDHCCGQTYIDLYNIDPKPERIMNIKICMDMLINTPQVDDWDWIDAIQMGMPVLAKMGVLYSDERYFEKMYEMFMYSKTMHGEKGLYNQQEGLWWRDENFDPPYKEPNGEDCYWSRGNGWVLAALVRVLDIIPENAPHRNEYIKTYKEMASALLKVQRSDGFWNVSLHDPSNFVGKETSGTALFVYGFAWGINNNILDRSTYLSSTLKAWNAIANESLHDNGFLGYVQGTGKEPKDGQPVTYDNVPDFEDYGLGCFLLAGSEVYKLK